MTVIDYPARVAQGMALLDEKMPGWAERIDLERLDIASGTHCVAAQLSGEDNYYRGFHLLGITGRDRFEHGFMAESTCECCNDGLTLPLGYNQDTAYATLTRLWREAIEQRQKASAPALEVALVA